MPLLAWMLAALYLATPLVAAGIAVRRNMREPAAQHIRAFAFTCVSGLVLGTTVTLVYAGVGGSRAPFGQILLSSYVFAAVLCLLKGLNWLLKQGAERAFRLRRPLVEGASVGIDRSFRLMGAMILRATLLFAIGMPYVMAVVMVYRPKVAPFDDPQKQMGFRFQPVNFTASDGVEISAWWIPASNFIPSAIAADDDAPAIETTLAGPPAPESDDAEPKTRTATSRPTTLRSRPAGWGERTVILCHGLGAHKGNQLLLARDLVPNGYNVLAFDFRAHGESGGQISSFGDLERRDVLAAVRWAREQRPEQSRKIYGLGVSMGAAALLAAAGDDSPEGRAIDAVAVYDTYDNLGTMADVAIRRYFAPPVDWLALKAALPIASAHAGTDLRSFSPVSSAANLWPRPLLVIHGRDDEIISFDNGLRLYNAAAQPKLRLWLGKQDPARENHFYDRGGARADHNGVLFSEDAARAVRLFFDWGQSIL